MSFNYYRKTRECSLLSVDQYSGSADLVPENEDPYDYYERGRPVKFSYRKDFLVYMK